MAKTIKIPKYVLRVVTTLSSLLFVVGGGITLFKIPLPGFLSFMSLKCGIFLGVSSLVVFGQNILAWIDNSVDRHW